MDPSNEPDPISTSSYPKEGGEKNDEEVDDYKEVIDDKEEGGDIIRSFMKSLSLAIF